MSDAGQLTVSELIAQVTTGARTGQEVVAGLLERIARLEPELAAWAWLDPDDALRQAATQDHALHEGGAGPLQGLPFGVKDIIDVAGYPTQAGFAPFRERIASADAAIVSRLRQLGAVPLGKTRTTQFASGDPAPTRNPWNPDRTPGGSSVGSAVAVAAGMVPLALGTQTAGSVLRPAAYCGVVGFKPSFNWFSRQGVIPLAWSLDHLGLLTRSVADAELVYRAVTRQPGTTAIESRPRIGLISDAVVRSAPEVAAWIAEVGERLGAAGAEVEPVALPVELDLILSVHGVIMYSEAAAVHAALLAAEPDAYQPAIRRQVEAGGLIPAWADLQARRLRRRIGRQFAGLLDAFDALLLPTAADSPAGRATTGDRSFQIPASLLGLPAISLPAGLSAAGLPLAAQLIGRRGDDLRLLALAGWCAERIGLIAGPDLD